jgi:hypothetical protein
VKSITYGSLTCISPEFAGDVSTCEKGAPLTAFFDKKIVSDLTLAPHYSLPLPLIACPKLTIVYNPAANLGEMLSFARIASAQSAGQALRRSSQEKGEQHDQKSDCS